LSDQQTKTKRGSKQIHRNGAGQFVFSDAKASRSDTSIAAMSFRTSAFRPSAIPGVRISPISERLR
jgi:hypothetical protein